VERRINDNSDGDDDDEFLAMWFGQDPKTISRALWNEKYNNNNNIVVIIIIIII